MKTLINTAKPIKRYCGGPDRAPKKVEIQGKDPEINSGLHIRLEQERPKKGKNMKPVEAG